MDDLVPAPPDVASSGWRRVGAPLIIGLFLLITAGSGILDLVSPARGPQLTGNDQADRNRERASAAIEDGSLMRYVDRELQEHSNVRRALVPWYIARCLLPLREGGAGIVVGKQGWLFLLDRILPRGGTHRPSHGPVAANILTAIERRLASLGIDTVLVPLPRKSTIASAYLPDGIDPNLAYEETLLRLLRERRIPHVNLYEVWQGMDPAELWQREDSHWSLRGMWYALDAASRRLGLWTPPEKRASAVVADRPIPVKRMLLVTLGIPLDHAAMASLEHESLASPLVRKQSLKKLPETDRRVVMVGTSFSATPAAKHQLSHIINRSAENLARFGTIVGITLEEALTQGSIPTGTQLIIEVPSFQLQGLGFSSEGPEPLNGSMLQPLSYVNPPHWSVLALTLPMSHPNRGGLDAGQLATTGDGIVSLQLSGKPQSAKQIRATLVCASGRLTQRWRPLDSSLLLPILSAGTGSPPLSLTLLGAPEDHKIRTQFVTELDLEHPTELAPMGLSKTPVGWEQEFALAPDAVESRHAALWIELAPRGPTGELEVQLQSATGEGHTVGRMALDAGGTALLRISAPPGAWTTVRLSGQGQKPERVGKVRIVDLPVP